MFSRGNNSIVDIMLISLLAKIGWPMYYKSMNIQHHLESLRAQPEHVRKRVAFWSSLGITAIIFVFWIASFASWGSINRIASVSATDATVSAPGQSLVAAVGSFFVDIKDMVFGPKKITYATVEVRPGK